MLKRLLRGLLSLSLKFLLVTSPVASPVVSFLTDFQTSVFIPEIVSRPNLRRQSYRKCETALGDSYYEAIDFQRLITWLRGLRQRDQYTQIIYIKTAHETDRCLGIYCF